jgi:preprotein translocase subunit SecF
MEEHTQKKDWYQNNYKKLLLIPAILLLISLISIGVFYQQTGDFIGRDVSLTGGTTITVFDEVVDKDEVILALEEEFPDIKGRIVSDIRSGKQLGFFVESKAEVDPLRNALEGFLGYELDNENSSIEFSGSALSEGFYKQLISSVLAAFILMSLVVFWVFGTDKSMKLTSNILSFSTIYLLFVDVKVIRYFAIMVLSLSFIYGIFSDIDKKNKIKYLISSFILAMLSLFLFPSSLIVIFIIIILGAIYLFHSIPSFAVVLAAGSDIVMTLAFVNFLGIDLSAAGIVAFLMLIGYSVDTDILLTTRLLKHHEGNVNDRLKDTFKTGMTMTLTALAAVGVSLVIIWNISDVLRQIFGILFIGLVFDMVNTWTANAGILKWYMEVKGLE